MVAEQYMDFVDFDEFEDFEVLGENLAIAAWRRYYRKLHNIFRLRRVWCHLGVYLRTYTRLR